MRRSEVVGNDWIIPQERYKTGLELVIPLSPAAQTVLSAVPKIGKSGFVFTTNGKRPIGGFSKFKGPAGAEYCSCGLEQAVAVPERVGPRLS